MCYFIQISLLLLIAHCVYLPACCLGVVSTDLYTWTGCGASQLMPKERGQPPCCLDPLPVKASPRTVHTAMWCRLMETDLSSSLYACFLSLNPWHMHIAKYACTIL